MNDVNGYVARMNKSIDYKKFWFDKVDPDKFDRIIDFGCGDGTLGIEALTENRFADKEVIFYETSSVMRKLLTSKILMLPESYVERATVISSVHISNYNIMTLQISPFKWQSIKCITLVQHRRENNQSTLILQQWL